jgi:Fe-S oxidoreductase
LELSPAIDLRFLFTFVVVFGSLAIASRSFLRLYRLARLARPEKLQGTLIERWGLIASIFFGQKKMFKDFWPGLVHALLFFGFIIVTLGSAEHLIEGFLHGFTFHFLFGPLYPWLIYVQDLFHGVVIATVLYFLWRRLVSHPKRLPRDPKFSNDGLIVLAFTGGHMIAGLFAFVFFILAGDAHHAFPEFRPVSSFVAHFLFPNGLDSVQAMKFAWIAWGFHISTVAGFLMYIPHSKHLHVFTTAPNIFFARLDPKGSLSTINFEDPNTTSFGVGKFTDFTWKDILDTYTCTACGRCNEFCPTATTAKPLKPMKLIQDLKAHVLRVGDGVLVAQSKDPNAAAEIPEPLISEQSGISEETVWACTTCRACVEACPVMIEHVDKIIDMRRHLVLMEGKMPPELQNTMKNWETQSNPWGMSADSRDAWAENLQVPRLADKPNAEYLFYVGCAGSFNDRNKRISTAVVKILNAAGIDFAILGKEELCNGETARRAGNEYLAKTMVDANIAVLSRYQVKKIITTCPHCFNTLKNEYPDFGFKAEKVLHHTDFINSLVKDGKISVTQGLHSQRIVFHDSCYLGRYNDLYEEPRGAIAAVTGQAPLEMPRNKTKGLCCGAGGARMWMEETIGKRINVERVEEALQQKPDIIAAGCPFCQVMLEDGIKTHHKQDQVKVRDVAELVAENLK